ncbi:MAG: PAS domain S-box protein, partial [Dehalococcoidia bacterium]
MKSEPTHEELTRRLTELEEIFKALQNQEVDAIIGSENVLMLRLKEAEENIRKQREGLEALLEEREELVEEMKTHQIALQAQADELREAEGKAKEARDKYLDLYDHAPVGYLTMSNRNFIEQANITLCRMLGLKREKLLKRSLTEFIAPESQDEFHLRLREIMSTGEGQSCEVSVRCPGGPFWARLNITPERDGLKVAMADVSNQRAAEEAVKEEKERLLALINSMTDEVWFCDTQGNFIVMNQAALEKIRIQAPGPAGLENILREIEVYRPDGSPRPPEDAQPLRALKGETIRGEEEIIQIGATGELEYRTVSSCPVRNDDGSIIGAVSVVRDVTESKKVERELERHRQHLQALVKERTAELQQSEENFRQSIESSPLGIRIVTAEGRTLYANRSLLDICGYGTIEELRNAPLSGLYSPESYAQHLERKAMRKQGIPLPDSYEVSIVSKDGELRHLEVHRREVVWGGRTEFQSTYEDITERKYAEERLAALSRRLLEVQEEERRNIALELHDEIGQSLNALKLLLDRLTRSVDGQLQSGLNESSGLTGEILERVRQFSLELRPKMLDDLGLLSTLVWYVHRYTDRTGIKVDFKHSGLNREFDRELSSNVYRIVQEALTNIARHAGT